MRERERESTRKKRRPKGSESQVGPKTTIQCLVDSYSILQKKILESPKTFSGCFSDNWIVCLVAIFSCGEVSIMNMVSEVINCVSKIHSCYWFFFIEPNLICCFIDLFLLWHASSYLIDFISFLDGLQLNMKVICLCLCL